MSFSLFVDDILGQSQKQAGTESESYGIGQSSSDQHHNASHFKH